VDQHSLETCSRRSRKPSKASIRCGNVTSLKDETGIIGPRDGAIYFLVCILWLIFLTAEAPAFIRGGSTTEREYNLSMSDWRLSATPYYAPLYGKWNTLVGSVISPSRLRSWEGFYAPQLADTFHSELLSHPNLSFTKYRVGNNTWKQSPRRMMWVSADPESEYRFSLNHIPGLSSVPFTPTLQRIREDVERALGMPFNAVLVNIYSHGHEHSDWHSDDDPWLGTNFTVPSLSLGGERDFSIRVKDQNKDGKAILTMPLSHGSLCTMEGSFQDDYEHSIPPVMGAKAEAVSKGRPRINLTFRFVVPELKHLHNQKATWGS